MQDRRCAQEATPTTARLFLLRGVVGEPGHGLGLELRQCGAAAHLVGAEPAGQVLLRGSHHANGLHQMVHRHDRVRGHLLFGGGDHLGRLKGLGKGAFDCVFTDDRRGHRPHHCQRHRLAIDGHGFAFVQSDARIGRLLFGGRGRIQQRPILVSRIAYFRTKQRPMRRVNYRSTATSLCR